MSDLSRIQILVLSGALLLLLFIGVQQCQTKSTGGGISDNELFGTHDRGLLTGDVTLSPGSCVYNDPKWTICSCSEDSFGHVTFSYRQSQNANRPCKQDPTGKQDKCTASDSNAYYDYSCPSGDGTSNGNKIKRCTMICDGSDKCSDAKNGGSYPPICVAPSTPGCVPNSCQTGQCGPMSDGCNGNLDCGTCSAGNTCSASNQCTAFCSDGLDNDGDGKTDFPADPGCTSASDTDETDPVPFCGDLICQTTETCTSCSTDCGSCPPPSGGSGFVQAQGNKLTLNGKDYTFLGFNNYGAANRAGIGVCGKGNNNGNNQNEYLDAMFATHKSYGFNAIRIWAFREFATRPDGTRDWTAIQTVIDKARTNGFKVIMVLENQWSDCTKAGQKTDQSGWYVSGYKNGGDGYPVSYKSYVQEIVTQYKDDNTVLMWQLINEMEGNHDNLYNFVVDMSDTIQVIDTKHMINPGTLATGQPGVENSVGNPSNFKHIHMPANIDLCETHDYTRKSSDKIEEEAWPDSTDQWNSVSISSSQCQTDLNKPIFFGEAGIEDWSCTPQNGKNVDEAYSHCYTKKRRSELFDPKMNESFNNRGVDGYIVWQWDNAQGANYGTSCSGYDNYCVTEGDPLLDVMKKYAPANQCPNGCPSGQYCDAGTCQNCKTQCDAGKNCGTQSQPAECGAPLNCGTCSGTQVCNANVCCQPQTCSQLGAQCGNIGDTCGGTLDCGTCTSGSCNAQNQCVFQCNDNVDNDGDGNKDCADAGCHVGDNLANACQPTDNTEANCGDGVCSSGETNVNCPGDCPSGPTLKATPANFKVAFIGDSGKDVGFESVLKLVRDEGADMAIEPGDLSYVGTVDGADQWAQDVRNILDPYWQSSGKMSEFNTSCNLFPFFITMGNHDIDLSGNLQWTDPNKGYRHFLRERLDCHGIQWDDAGHNGDWLGTRSSWAYQNLFMVATAHENQFGGGEGESNGGNDGAGTKNKEVADYVYNKMWKNQYLWDVSFHHRNQKTMQVYHYGPHVGWNIYENVRKAGGMTFTAHTHTYARTWILDNMQATSATNVVDKTDPLTIWNEDPALNRVGRTFATDVGAGGQSVRSQDRCAGSNNYQYPYASGIDADGYPCNGIWASAMTSQDANNKYGAYFVEFNVDGDPRKARAYFKTAVQCSDGKWTCGKVWDEPGTESNEPFVIYNDATVPP